MKKFWKNHKTLSIVIILVVVIGGYYGYKKITTKPAVTRYVLSPVTRDTLISTVTDSGQTSAVNQIDVKPKVSGDVTAVLVSSSQAVKAGQVLFRLDTTDAAKAVRDAKTSLAAAQLSLDKLKRGSLPAQIQNNVLSVQTAQNNIATYQNNLNDVKSKADNDLANVYDDTKSVLQDTYNKMHDILEQQLVPLFNNGDSATPTLSFLTSDSGAQHDAENQRVTAGAALVEIQATINGLTANDYSTYDTALTDVGSQLNVMYAFISRLSAAADAGIPNSSTPDATLSGYRSSVNSARGTITAAINSINNQIQTIASQKITNKNNISAAETKISDSQTALTTAQINLNLQQAPADPLDIQNQEISVQQKQNALTDAETAYADYTIKAPFDGVIAAVNVKVGDPASSGAAMATLITQQQIAEITVNEIDAAKIKVGDKATLTFDAVADLSISGEIAEIDTVGTVSQGVVSYAIKIAFDTQDTRVKPGMTVSAAIITDMRANVLVVPNGAIKSQGSNYYVEMIDNPIQPAAGETGVTTATSTREQFIQIGEANDIETEVTAGLNEGDQIVTKTITAAAAAATSATSGTAARTTGGTAAGGAPAGGASAAGGLFRALGR